MRLIRMLRGTTSPMVRGCVQVCRVDDAAYGRYIEAGSGMPICGNWPPEQAAALATAAAALGVTIHIPASASPENAALVEDAAKSYGAHYTLTHAHNG